MTEETKHPEFTLKNPSVAYLSLWGVGFSPHAPGTMGSLATIPLLWTLGYFGTHPLMIAPILLLWTAGTCYIAHSCEKELGVHDPSWIVMDEVLGMVVTWMFLPTDNALWLMTIFGFFRFFDIIKIWPASYFDQKIKGGVGTVIDDLMSGVYAGICVRILHYFL